MKFSAYNQSDKQQIKKLFESVFSESEALGEGILIAGLVIDLMNTTKDQDIFGFVARDKDKIIGCIFFTRLSFNTPIEAFILSPVAVDTKYQRKGIGQKLINYGLGVLKKNGVQLAFTYGDPHYYSKVGFSSIDEDVVKAPHYLTQPEGCCANH